MTESVFMMVEHPVLATILKDFDDVFSQIAGNNILIMIKMG